jgi:inorganic pyrophosphatase
MHITKSALSFLLLASRATAWTAHGLPRGRFLIGAHLNAVAGISTDVVGQEKTESFRLKFKEGDKTLSPWHDIDLSNEDGSFNMVSKPIL